MEKFLSAKQVGSAISLSKITGNKRAEPVLTAATANNQASDFNVLAAHTNTAAEKPDHASAFNSKSTALSTTADGQLNPHPFKRASHRTESNDEIQSTSLADRSLENAGSGNSSIEEQLSNIDQAISHHDIGGNEYDDPLNDTMAFSSKQGGLHLEPVPQDVPTASLSSRTQGELVDLVSGLNSDKIKLQKLVIAQKAAIESQRQLHLRTRILAKDALTVMRVAREGQRVAEKIARRERSKRQRIAEDYVKVRNQLRNAMSTVNFEKAN